ncbi:unnamed protein product [Brachionus calyciflorus]|uniref:Uncharacterized protein n=1 Tax=Brachionus calyciflorus TaxID=104777 RepID=A0A813WM37_9BILA|nr:unnamed protein product [Brachionus calyciflorus]
MTQDIKDQIARCIQCIKYNNSGTKEHTAKSIPVTGLHDKIGIDLVLGLPKTSSGFLGVLVIIEYLSKFVWAVPIKSKEAKEAKQLFEYISLFGAPKSIQSDQGKEFLNKLIAELTKISGVEHRITSAYHPRTNGLVENFNKTLICCIRKHAEENPIKWDDWLPFVLMAYRSRIHPSTKFTPFELFFGRKMNNLEDWSNQKEEEEEYALYRRSEEIRKLYNFNVPMALDSVEKSQERQRQVQNRRENSKISEEIIENGTKVFIKAVGLQNKLEPKFYGPYTVVGQTPNGNYWLENSKNKKLKTLYPRSRLKVVPSEVGVEEDCDKRPHEEVEEIIKHRKRNGKIQYLVKWKDFPDDQNEWVNEDDFDTTEIIEEYQRKITKETNQVGLNAVAEIKGKSSKSVRFSKALLFISILAFCMVTSNAIVIRENFRYCTVGKHSPILTGKDSCDHLHQGLRFQSQDTFILEKRQNMVEGYGYICEKTQIVVTTWENFWGNWRKSRVENPIKVSREECLYMAFSEKCMDSKMTCSHSECILNQEPKEKYEYFREMSFESYHCKVSKKHISSKNKNQPFHFGAASCSPNSFECFEGSKTLVWQPSIIKNCEFRRLNKLIRLNVTNSLAVADSENLFFQIIESKFDRNCKINITKTAEGIYLSADKEAKDLEIFENEINEKNHQILQTIHDD